MTDDFISEDDLQTPVDLVEPGHEPLSIPWTIVERLTFCDIVPWVVLTVIESPR